MAMKTQKVTISSIKANPNNPRIIKDDKFKKLVASIKEFPEMLEIRPIVVNADMVVLGGNMRLKACKEAGMKEIPIIMAEDLTEEQQREFIIKDNVGFGEWDWEMLANEWDPVELGEWGLDIEDVLQEKEDQKYTQKIEAPNYEPTRNKPEISELYDQSKTDQLINEIADSDIPDEVKSFLEKAAQRHTVFDYENIAEYYAHADPDVQRLMERSALVIIDFQQAIEEGYVMLSKRIIEQYEEDNEQ